MSERSQQLTDREVAVVIDLLAASQVPEAQSAVRKFGALMTPATYGLDLLPSGQPLAALTDRQLEIIDSASSDDVDSWTSEEDRDLCRALNRLAVEEEERRPAIVATWKE